MGLLKNIVQKVGNAVKTAATKVAEVVKVAAPAALTLVSKSGLLPGGPMLQTIASSLINKTNAPAASTSQVTAAKAAVIDSPAIGQFQGSGAAVKTVDGKVSVPINGNGLGQMNQVAPLTTIVSSGHLITSNGSVVQALPIKGLTSAAATNQLLPASEPLKKIQDIVNVINDQEEPAPTNAPKPEGSKQMPQWLTYVLWGTGILFLLWIVYQIIQAFTKKR